MTTANRYLNIRDDGTPLLERGIVTFDDGSPFSRLVSTGTNGLISPSLLPPREPTILEHVQYPPVDTWVINHNFGFIPVIQVFSLNRELVACDILHDSLFQISICSFTTPFAGTAILVVPYRLSSTFVST